MSYSGNCRGRLRRRLPREPSRSVEEGRLIVFGAEELFEEALAVVEEAADDVDGCSFFVGDLVDVAIVEGEDLRARKAEENGRVGGDDELRVLVVAESLVEHDEERELALG